MPARTPQHLKVLFGTARSDRQPKQKVTPKRKPRKPRSLDSVASKHWDDIVRTRGDWLDQSDGPALLLICRTWAHLVRIEGELRDDPSNYRALLGFQMMAKQWRQMAVGFGLDPISRERLGTIETDKTRSELAERFLG